MPFHLVELCCGSAALSMHLLGAKRAIVPYHGSKWRLRKKLSALLAENGFTELGSFHLNDIGPWGRTWPALLSRSQLTMTANILRTYVLGDARSVYKTLQGYPVPTDAPEYHAAQHLLLQRLSVNGKAVGTRDGRWMSPDFNRTSAYGCEATDRFGAIRPMLPYLIEILENLSNELRWDLLEQAAGHWSWDDRSIDRLGFCGFHDLSWLIGNLCTGWFVVYFSGGHELQNAAVSDRL